MGGLKAIQCHNNKEDGEIISALYSREECMIECHLD